MKDGRSISDFLNDVETMVKKQQELMEEMDDKRICVGSSFCLVGNNTFEEIRNLVKETPKITGGTLNYDDYELTVNGVRYVSTYEGKRQGRVNRFEEEAK